MARRVLGASRMGYAPRFVPPNSVVEVTIRTVQGRRLLKPTPELRRRILRALGRALHLYPVQLHAFVYLSNHAHLLLTTPDANLLARFLQHLNKNVGNAVRAVTSWTGPVWEPHPEYAVITDDAKALVRLFYICSNSVKEGLVATPTDWPGASSASNLLSQRDTIVLWSTLTDRRAARRDGKPVTSRAYQQLHRVHLTPLPPLRDRTSDELRAFYRRMFDDIAKLGAIARAGAPPLPREALLDCDPEVTFPRPRGTGPLVHASTRDLARDFLDARDDFLEVHRHASLRLAAGELDVAFPPGSFPPRRPFVPFQTLTVARPPP